MNKDSLRFMLPKDYKEELIPVLKQMNIGEDAVSDFELMLLYRILLLEEQANRLELQTQTHWVR